VTPETANHLLALNRRFYARAAESFARTRATAQPGFAQVVDWLPTGRLAVLDAGCGEGRFGRFLAAAERLAAYIGLDGDRRLLQRAARTWPAGAPAARFVQRDLALPAALQGLPPADLVVCLATLQHIPGVANRRALLQALGRQLQPGGTLLLSTWQFPTSARQRRKEVDWALAGLSAADVEPGDALLTWQGDRQQLRYVAAIDEPALRDLSAAAGLTLSQSLRADGREGDLNLYARLTRDGAGNAVS
jgi:SAM-dependent methyltransferase